MSQTIYCDVAVIGAGTAGLSAERAARSHGAETRLIDPSLNGTVCASVGCMPSKLLIAASRRAQAVRDAQIFGLKIPDFRVDGVAVMERVRRVRDEFVDGVRDSFEALPDGTLLKAEARFSGPMELDLGDGCRLLPGAIVIATGSAPVVPDAFETIDELVLTNQSVFEIEDLPGSLAVIGSGYIGLELAQAFARLGVKVHVFDHGRQLAGLADADIANALAASLKDDFDITGGVEVEAERKEGSAHLSWTGDSSGEGQFDRVLVAAGRAPNLDGLNLGRSGLELDDSGVPVFDPATLQCGNQHVFIAGDVNGKEPVLHVASDEGAVAGRNAACSPDTMGSERVPPFTIMFTDPPVASIGASPTRETIVGASDFGQQGRAKVDGVAKGAVHIYADPETGRLTGAALACPGADHLAHLLAWAIQRGEAASDLLRRPFYHPTLEEGLKDALRDICSAVSSPLPNDRDRGNPPGA